MKLIDANEIYNDVVRRVYTDDLGTTIAVGLVTDAIANAPAVEAIPIEYINEKLDKERQGSTMWWAILTLRNEWQKEQREKG